MVNDVNISISTYYLYLFGRESMFYHKVNLHYMYVCRATMYYSILWLHHTHSVCTSCYDMCYITSLLYNVQYTIGLFAACGILHNMYLVCGDYLGI